MAGQPDHVQRPGAGADQDRRRAAQPGQQRGDRPGLVRAAGTTTRDYESYPVSHPPNHIAVPVDESSFPSGSQIRDRVISASGIAWR